MIKKVAEIAVLFNAADMMALAQSSISSSQLASKSNTEMQGNFEDQFSNLPPDSNQSIPEGFEKQNDLIDGQLEKNLLDESVQKTNQGEDRVTEEL